LLALVVCRQSSRHAGQDLLLAGFQLHEPRAKSDSFGRGNSSEAFFLRARRAGCALLEFAELREQRPPSIALPCEFAPQSLEICLLNPERRRSRLGSQALEFLLHRSATRALALEVAPQPLVGLRGGGRGGRQCPGRGSAGGTACGERSR